MPYRLNESTGLIDYDMLEKTATLFRPKIIVAGGQGGGGIAAGQQGSFAGSSPRAHRVLALPSGVWG